MSLEEKNADVVVVGGGPAGIMAAISAAKNNRKVLLIDKNEILAKKLRITGKGRCNVTNNCDVRELVENVSRGGKFLYSAFSGFSAADTIEFFENAGVPLKTERGSRVFPESDRAKDIAEALIKEAKDLDVSFITDEVKSIETKDGAADKVILASGKTVAAESVVIATGGKSYHRTGSTGDGYIFAKKLGHKITDPRGALVPIETVESDAKEMQGLSLKNVSVKLIDKENGKTVFEDFGEMLFTHFGLSGPIILSLSCHIEKDKEYFIDIDLKPALTNEMLDKRLLREFSASPNKAICNVLRELLPLKSISVVLKRSGVASEKAVNSITVAERRALLNEMKRMRFEFKALRPIEEAIITSGGVELSEINPKTMESKIVKGLYFAGEVIDANAYTGGFNLQIAFSTGYLAGQNA